MFEEAPGLVDLDGFPPCWLSIQPMTVLRVAGFLCRGCVRRIGAVFVTTLRPCHKGPIFGDGCRPVVFRSCLRGSLAIFISRDG